ncbi:MAG: CHAP domain-containing protein [Deltaproteobacteria bacterium]|nr:CHAP domain-containing protein [Deltaproteobacteria bacterium]
MSGRHRCPRAWAVAACVVVAGLGLSRPVFAAPTECGAQTREIGSVCSPSSTPRVCTFDDFPAFDQCNVASDDNVYVYTWEGRHTSPTRPSSSWKLTNRYGYQCVEFALRYFFGRWAVPSWPNVVSAAAMCDRGAVPAEVLRIDSPTIDDVVPGDLMVFEPDNPECETGSWGHVAVVNDVNRDAGTVQNINENCAIATPTRGCVTNNVDIGCARCILHARNNVQPCVALGPPPATPSPNLEDGLCFACGNATRDRVAGGEDWSYGHYKAGCGLTQAATGLSMSTTFGTDVLAFAHDLLCRLDDDTKFVRTSCREEVVFDAGENRGTTEYGDWDPGFYKGECAPDEYVVGISQTTNLALFSIRCCRGNVAHDDCRPVVFADGNNFDGASMINDWDETYYKGECAPGRHIAGVSQKPGTGEPHAILCCGAGVVPPVDGGDADIDAPEDGSDVGDVAAAEADGPEPSDREGGADDADLADDGEDVDGGGGDGCGCRATGGSGAAGWGWFVLACLGCLLLLSPPKVGVLSSRGRAEGGCADVGRARSASLLGADRPTGVPRMLDGEGPSHLRSTPTIRSRSRSSCLVKS